MCTKTRYHRLLIALERSAYERKHSDLNKIVLCNRDLCQRHKHQTLEAENSIFFSEVILRKTRLKTTLWVLPCNQIKGTTCISQMLQPLGVLNVNLLK